MSTIQRVGRLKGLDHRTQLGYDRGVVARTSAKQELAAQAWRPLARFFFDTVRHRQRILSSEGLSPNDIRALMVLDPSEGRAMSDLADAWSCDASNATFIVDRLEERGLAERRTVATDRRLKLVVLTVRGAEVRGRVLERFFEPPPELLELSSADLEALREVADRLPVTEGWGSRATEPSHAS
jgi:DNA-binding MarR family transcriptional regulator